jgi:hypothetical protein
MPVKTTRRKAPLRNCPARGGKALKLERLKAERVLLSAPGWSRISWR